MVGILLQLPQSELEEMVAARSKFQSRLKEVLKGLGLAGGGNIFFGFVQEDLKGGGKTEESIMGP